MRKTAVTGTMLQAPLQAPWRELARITRFAAIAIGVGLVLAAGPVKAGDDDDDDDKTFEEKIIDNIMRGVGGTNMEKAGIDYRERSPLVVPPKLDLPPPGTASAEKMPNWPKDPDEARRKAAIAARKKANKDPQQAGRTLLPSELNQKAAGRTSGGDSQAPGPGGASVMLSPSQLGYDGGVLGFFKGNKTESAEFKGEPDRDSLTQPPVGYQTPSPKYLYGTGPKESLNKQCNPVIGDCKD